MVIFQDGVALLSLALTHFSYLFAGKANDHFVTSVETPLQFPTCSHIDLNV